MQPQVLLADSELCMISALQSGKRYSASWNQTQQRPTRHPPHQLPVPPPRLLDLKKVQFPIMRLSRLMQAHPQLAIRWQDADLLVIPRISEESAGAEG